MEAASRDEEVEDEVKRKIDEALACTCVDDLKEGPCGDSFVEAFSCFIRSQHKSLEVSRNENYSHHRTSRLLDDRRGRSKRWQSDALERDARELNQGHGLFGGLWKAQGKKALTPQNPNRHRDLLTLNSTCGPHPPQECMIRNPEQFEDFAEAFKPKDGKGPED